MVRSTLSCSAFVSRRTVLYVIILSAALDLVPPSTPKGIIAFCNIFPSMLAKLGWPYLLRGRVRYARRLVGCATISILGMWVSRTHFGADGVRWVANGCSGET